MTMQYSILQHSILNRCGTSLHLGTLNGKVNTHTDNINLHKHTKDLQRIRFHFVHQRKVCLRMVGYQASVHSLAFKRRCVLSFVLLTQIYLVFFVVCINTEWVFLVMREKLIMGRRGGLWWWRPHMYIQSKSFPKFCFCVEWTKKMEWLQSPKTKKDDAEEYTISTSTVSCCFEMSTVATQQLKVEKQGQYLGRLHWYDNQPPRPRVGGRV